MKDIKLICSGRPKTHYYHDLKSLNSIDLYLTTSIVNRPGFLKIYGGSEITDQTNARPGPVTPLYGPILFGDINHKWFSSYIIHLEPEVWPGENGYSYGVPQHLWKTDMQRFLEAKEVLPPPLKLVAFNIQSQSRENLEIVDTSSGVITIENILIQTSPSTIQTILLPKIIVGPKIYWNDHKTLIKLEGCPFDGYVKNNDKLIYIIEQNIDLNTIDLSNNEQIINIQHKNYKLYFTSLIIKQEIEKAENIKIQKEKDLELVHSIDQLMLKNISDMSNNISDTNRYEEIKLVGDNLIYDLNFDFGF